MHCVIMCVLHLNYILIYLFIYLFLNITYLCALFFLSYFYIVVSDKFINSIPVCTTKSKNIYKMYFADKALVKQTWGFPVEKKYGRHKRN